MNEAISITHRISVTLFFLIYVVKTVLLLSSRTDLLQKFTKATKVIEMIVSALFLITGVWLMTKLAHIETILIVKIVIVLASIPIAVVGFKKGNKISNKQFTNASRSSNAISENLCSLPGNCTGTTCTWGVRRGIQSRYKEAPPPACGKQNKRHGDEELGIP